MSQFNCSPETVESTLRNIQKGYDNIMVDLFDNVQNDFVEKMKTIWGSTNAQTFFEKMGDAWNKLSVTDQNSIENKIQSIFNSINSAAIASDQTHNVGNSQYTSIAFIPGGRKLNVEGYPTRLPGNRGFGIFENVDGEFMTNINNFKKNVDLANTELDNIQKSCSEEMFGSDVMTVLNDSVSAIKNGLNAALKSVSDDIVACTEGEEGAASDLHTKIKDAFSGQGV